MSFDSAFLSNDKRFLVLASILVPGDASEPEEGEPPEAEGDTLAGGERPSEETRAELNRFAAESCSGDSVASVNAEIEVRCGEHERNTPYYVDPI